MKTKSFLLHSGYRMKTREKSKDVSFIDPSPPLPAFSDSLETGSTLRRAACPCVALCFTHGVNLLPPKDDSGLILRCCSIRKWHCPAYSRLAVSVRFAQLVTVSHIPCQMGEPL